MDPGGGQSAAGKSGATRITVYHTVPKIGGQFQMLVYHILRCRQKWPGGQPNGANGYIKGTIPLIYLIVK